MNQKIICRVCGCAGTCRHIYIRGGGKSFTNLTTKMKKLQGHTYHKAHKSKEDTNKAPVTQASPPQALAFEFLYIKTCDGSTPTTLESRNVRWKNKIQSTAPTCCLIILIDHCHQVFLHVKMFIRLINSVLLFFLLRNQF